MMLQPNVELIRGNHEQMLLECDFILQEVDEKEFYNEEQLKSEIEAVEAHLSEAADDIKSNETKTED